MINNHANKNMNFRQVHLDFHTSEAIEDIGCQFDKKQFQEALRTGHVNSVTVFSKCHHGWAYHPSKANEMHPNLKFDLLKAQIEAAHEIGVKTPVYLSAGLDEKCARIHPEWLVRKKDDTTGWVSDFMHPGYHKFCMNTPYLDYLLAQVREVLENYDADGIFLDITGVQPCYCHVCRQQLRDEGKTPKDDAAVFELAERVYANYTKRVRETIDSVRPGLSVFHNGGHIDAGRRDLAKMNSHLELESLPTGGWGYDHFPLSSRYSQGLGMEFLGMTGKFHTTWGEFGGFKHPNALRYEVSLNAANGAKTSIGDQLHPWGKADMATYKLIGAAYSELEEKEPWLDNVTAVADVALFPYEAYSRSFSTEQVGKNTSVDAGVARILLEGKYLFDVVDFESDFNKYKVVILPDFIRISPRLKAKLDEFLKNGGKLLATGKSGLYADRDEFAFDFGADYVGENEYRPSYMRPEFEMEGLFSTAYVMYSEGEVINKTTGEELASLENSFFNRDIEHFSSHAHTPNKPVRAGTAMVEGRDGIYFAWQAFSEYADKGSLILKRAMTYALDKLLGESKTIATNLPAQGVTTLMKQGDRYINHLLYASPVKRGENVEIIEDIIPVYNTEVKLKLEDKISKVYLAPQMTEIPFEQKDSFVTYTVEKLDCHQMVVLETENNN